MRTINGKTLTTRLERAIIGYPQLIAAMVAAYYKRLAGLPRSHVLMFGPPGVGKTYATKTFASMVAEVAGDEVGYGRIQGRADLMPEEFLSERIVDYTEEGRPQFVHQVGTVGRFEAGDALPGVLQFDELDKTPGRTQHGLLEAMEEQTLTLGDGRQIPLSFVLVATANTRRFDPASQPIPRATQDRFGSVVFVDYLPLDGDREVLDMHVRNWNLGVTADPQLLAGLVKVVKLSQRKLDGYSDFTQHVKVPAGPRGYLDLFTEAATTAMIEGRSHLTVQDVRDVATRTLRGRIEVKAEAEIAGKPVEVLITDMVEEVFGGMRLVAPPSPPQLAEDAEEKAESSKRKEESEREDGEDGSSGQDGQEENAEGQSEDEGETSDSGDSGGEPSEDGGQDGESGEQPAAVQSGSTPSPSQGNGSGSHPSTPRTRPTGGQGRRPSNFLSGFRDAAREEPQAPFGPSPR